MPRIARAARPLGAALPLAAVILLTVALVLAWPSALVYTGAALPDQSHTPVALPAPQHPILSIAHNAGNHPVTAARALEHGARVVEIDVTLARGELVAGRPQPVAWLAEALFSGQTLAEAWQHTAAAPVTKLDLKQSDSALLAALGDFLRTHDDGRQVWVTTDDPAAVLALSGWLHFESLSNRKHDVLAIETPGPNVALMITAANPAALTAIQADEALTERIDGLSVFHHLVTPQLVQWAHDRDLAVIAWTVRDEADAARLIAAGVDGITTPNLAIIEHLSPEVEQAP
jgi:hypothetical protein